ncbi:hypothetical protein [Glycomyces xiaoerkulensis]|uniref:hypothetical protein n=1 Tax=Glycomyces xiaoerkulensis TaxID=2038139 RepID=UPI000C256EF6|nr:hypothetical protein [Glycomyces xiaoerkulensis]
MGLFGAAGREVKGAMRSIRYDLRHSRRFRRTGAIAVVTVAGGVLAAGAMLRGPVPEMMGVDSDRDGAGISEGWFGFGAETRGQDPEPDAEPTTGPVGPGPDSAGGSESPTAEAPTSSGGPEPTTAPAGTLGEEPELNPVDDRSGGRSPSPEGSTRPTESPEPSPEPTTTGPSPSGSPTPSPSPSESTSPEPTGTESTSPG